MIHLANGLVIVGACILVTSLFPIQRLISRLPPGEMRGKWRILRGIIVFFIAGYIGYAAATWGNHWYLRDVIAPAIFFLGACSMFMVSTLALRTALDVRRIADLEQENITDPLMGIHNRRYLDRRLKEEVERALRYDLPLSVLLIDIDHFKRVNDGFGHQVGDIVLRNLGKMIMNTARTTDVVARYGGEEILVIATSTPSQSVRKFAERLRKAVEESVLVPPCEVTGGRPLGVTVSIGTASLGPEAVSAEALVKTADDALYRAKYEGRNRIVFEADPAPSPNPGA
jgi:diguanylate cyclase (GGDEF)-like protein